MNKDGYCDPTAETAIRNVEKRRRRELAYNNSFAKCRSCGRQIIWIRMKTGKNMPVDTMIINYKYPAPGEKAKDRIVTPSGEVISANVTKEDNYDGTGYISHFATCPHADRHRRR